MTDEAKAARPRILGSKALGELTQHIWLLRESTMDSLRSVLTRHAMGNRLEPAEIEAFIEARQSRCEMRRDGAETSQSRPYSIVNGVAVVPVGGLLVKYASSVNGVSQPRGTSMESLKSAMRMAANDDAASQITLDIDSPGGSGQDIAETADLIERIDAKQKPVTAIVEGGSCCSGAIWLASATRRIYATRASQIGSIGVISVIVDASQAVEDEGLKVHVLRYGDNKNIGLMPGEAVSQEAIDHHMKGINELGDMFVAAIGKGRGLEAEAAKALADGSVHFATQAKRLGLVDEIVRDFDHALERIGKASNGEGAAGGRSASSDQREEKEMAEEKAPARYSSAEELEKHQPDLAAALENRGAERERKRAAAITEMAHAGQEAVRDECISQGVSAEDARARLHDDLRKQMEERDAKIAQTRGEVGTPDGTKDDDDDEFKDVAAAPTGASFESQVLADWNSNKNGCKSRHSAFSVYLNYRENERAKEAKKR